MALALFERGPQIREKLSTLAKRLFRKPFSRQPQIPTCYRFGESLIPIRAKQLKINSVEPIKEEVIEKIEQQYSNPPISGMPYIAPIYPAIMVSGMINVRADDTNVIWDTPSPVTPLTTVEIDLSNNMIRSIGRTYGGEIEVLYQGPIQLNVPVRVISGSEIDRVTQNRTLQPIRIMGGSATGIVPGPTQWEVRTINGEVFRS